MKIKKDRSMAVCSWAACSWGHPKSAIFYNKHNIVIFEFIYSQLSSGGHGPQNVFVLNFGLWLPIRKAAIGLFTSNNTNF